MVDWQLNFFPSRSDECTLFANRLFYSSSVLGDATYSIGFPPSSFGSPSNQSSFQPTNLLLTCCVFFSVISACTLFLQTLKAFELKSFPFLSSFQTTFGLEVDCGRSTIFILDTEIYS